LVGATSEDGAVQGGRPTADVPADGNGTFSCNHDTGQRMLEIYDAREVAVGYPGTMQQAFTRTEDMGLFNVV
jgi:hypothetical protein